MTPVPRKRAEIDEFIGDIGSVDFVNSANLRGYGENVDFASSPSFAAAKNGPIESFDSTSPPPPEGFAAEGL